MGACYSVQLKVTLTDEKGAIKALNEHILKDTRTDYSLEEYLEEGITTETFDDLMKILLAELQSEVSIWQEGKFRYYENDFDASYGWECVLMEWFEVLAPFLKDNSKMLIYPDSDYDELVIKNGKCIRIH